jgi:hypothetical protein
MKKTFHPTPVPMPPVEPPRHAVDKPSRLALLRDLERCGGDASDCAGCQLERTTRCKQRLLSMTAEMLNVACFPYGMTFVFSPKCANCTLARIVVSHSRLMDGETEVLSETIITCENASICDALEARFKGEGKD